MKIQYTSPLQFIYIAFLFLVLLLPKHIKAQNECAERTWEWGPSLEIIAYETADLGNDGITEIITSSSQLFGPFRTMNFWQIYSYDPLSGKYDNRFIRQEYEDAIIAIKTYDFNQDGTLEIFLFIGTSGRNTLIKIIDSNTFEEIDRINIQQPTKAPFFGDIDNDSTVDLVLTNGRGGYTIVDLDSLKQKSFNQGSFQYLRNVDDDPEIEAISYNHTGYTVGIHNFNGNQASLDTVITISRGNGGIQQVLLMDIDEDDKDEVIVAQRTGHSLLIYDADSSKLKWEFKDTTAVKVFPMTTLDLNGDGTEELIFVKQFRGSSFDGIACLDIKNREILWEIDTMFYGLSIHDPEISLVNVDADSAVELLVFDNGNFTVYELDPPGITYDIPRGGGSLAYFPTLVDDIDSDGEMEYIIAGNIYANTNLNAPTDPYGGWIHIYDANTYTAEFSSLYWGNGARINNSYDIAIGDIDGDSNKEIVIVGERSHDSKGMATILDANTYEVDTTIFFENGTPLTNVEIVDLENDGQMELIFSIKSESFNPGYFIYCLNGADLSYKFDTLKDRWVNGTGVYSMRAGDIDGNGDDEIIVQMVQTISNDNDNTYAIDLDSNGQVQIDTIFKNFYGWGLDIKDMNGDGIADVISGNGLGTVKIYDYVNDSLLWEKKVSDYAINCIRAYNIDSDSALELVFIDDGALSIYDIEEDLLKCTDIFGHTFGHLNNMYIGDKNNDGSIEVFSSGIISVIEFELNKFYGVGIEELVESSMKTLEVFPNPNQGKFKIKLPDYYPERLNIKIFDLTGRLVGDKYAKPDHNSEIQMQMDNLNEGIYVVQVWHGNTLIGYQKVNISIGF